jgi:hypothetical protein
MSITTTAGWSGFSRASWRVQGLVSAGTTLMIAARSF